MLPLLSAPSCCLRAASDPADRVLIDHLRARGLDQLAEIAARKHMDDAKADAGSKGAAGMALAAVLSRRGCRTTDAAQRRRLWTEADRLAQAAAPPDAVVSETWVDLQQSWASVLLERARFMHDLSLATPNDAEIKRDAVAAAAVAPSAWQQLRDRLRVFLDKHVQADDQTWRRLADRDTTAQLYLAMAWLSAAKAAPDANAKTAALSKTEAALQGLVGEYSTLPLVLEALLTRAEAARVAGQPDRGLKLLESFAKHPETPEPFAGRARLLTAQILLDASRVDEALRLLDVPEDKRVLPGEWAVTLLEALLRSPGDAPSNARRQEQALAILDALESRFGRYWMLRGDRVLSRHGKLDALGDNPRALRRTAALFQERREFPRAVELLDRAVKLASANGESDLAFQCALDAAEIRVAEENYADAAARFAACAKESPRHPQASATLLRAAACWGQQFDRTKEPTAREKHRALVAQVLRDYPASESAGEAHWLAGELAETDGKLDAALTHYGAVPANHPRFADALETWASLQYDRLFGESSESTADKNALTNSAADLNRLVQTGTQQHARAPTPGLARALAVARLVQGAVVPKVDRASAQATGIMLESQVVKNPALPERLRAQAWSALLAAQVLAGDAAAARKTAEQGFPKMESALLAAVLSLPADGLSAVQQKARLGAAEAAAVHLFADAEKWPAADRLNLQVLLGETYLAKGETERARRLFWRLRDESPRDPRVVEGLARTAAAGGEMQESLKHWIQLVNGLPRGTERWATALYHAARTHHQLGSADKAKELVQFALRFYPAGGSPTLRKQIQELDQELRQAK